ASVTSTCRQRPSACGRQFAKECACTRCEGAAGSVGGGSPAIVGARRNSVVRLVFYLGSVARAGEFPAPVENLDSVPRFVTMTMLGMKPKGEAMTRIAIVASLLAVGLVAALAQSDPIAARKELMTLNGKAFYGDLNRMVRGQAPYDQAKV